MATLMRYSYENRPRRTRRSEESLWLPASALGMFSLQVVRVATFMTYSERSEA